jgi:hypothetical protein
MADVEAAMTARGAAARRKGHSTERWFARDLGVPTTRNVRPGIHDDAGDLVLPGWAVEIKDQARWRIEMWWDGIADKALPGDEPALIVKRTGIGADRALVVVRYEWWKGHA